MGYYQISLDLLNWSFCFGILYSRYQRIVPDCIRNGTALQVSIKFEKRSVPLTEFLQAPSKSNATTSIMAHLIYLLVTSDLRFSARPHESNLHWSLLLVSWVKWIRDTSHTSSFDCLSHLTCSTSEWNNIEFCSYLSRTPSSVHQTSANPHLHLLNEG